jgi:hypothetical protein
MNSKNTGKFRLCRNQNGVGGTRTILSEHRSAEECINALEKIEKETGWAYYCEQEVIYINTLKDENGNLIDSTPTWIPL